MSEAGLYPYAEHAFQLFFSFSMIDVKATLLAMEIRAEKAGR